MRTTRRLTTCLVLALLVSTAVPALAASSTPTSRIVSCTTTRDSVTVQWFTAKTAVNKKITGYAILTRQSQSPRRMYGVKARTGTVHGLTPRTAYRVQLYPFVRSGAQKIPSCVVYTKLLNGKPTTPMRPPLITSVTSTETTITVTWQMNKSATSALPSSYQVSVFNESAVNANVATATSVQEPLSAHSFTFTGLTPGTSFYVDVGTNNVLGDSSVSRLIATVLPTTTTTSAPTTSTTTSTTLP